MPVCAYCGKEVESLPGKRARKYCNNNGVCKQMDYYQRHKPAQTVKDMPLYDMAEVEALRAQVADQAQQIAELEAKNHDLQKVLTKERKDRESYQDQASEVALTWMHENARLKTELERVKHQNGPSEEDQTIEDLQAQVADLQQRIENEKNFLRDTKARLFKSWLKKQPASSWRTTFVSDQRVPARGTRSHYEAHLRRLFGFSGEEEYEDFIRLWRLFLLERP